MTTAQQLMATALLLATAVTVARAQPIANVSLSNTSTDGSASGCCPSCAQGKTTVAVVSQSGTSFTSRFAATIAADSRLTTAISRSLTSAYAIGFDVTCPAGGYRLTVDTRLTGAFTHVDDSLGCGVAGSAQSDLSAVSGSQTGGTLSGSLGLLDPGGVGPTGGNQNVPFERTDTATITGTSTGAPIHHSLSFSWTGECDSNGNATTCGLECAVRLGIEADSGLCGPTDGISADDYPGAGNRDSNNDGHFVTASLDCFCGNGGLDAGEQCDAGAANGQSGSCCSATCQLLSAGATCRAVAGPCDLAETCDGVIADCPADEFKTAGAGCPDDGNQCTNDQCSGNTAACGHPDKPHGAPCNAGAGSCDGAGACGPLLPTPSPTPTATPVSLCGATPLSGCRTPNIPAKAALRLKDAAGSSRDLLIWRWTHGAATSTSDFGNPVSSTNYSLCLYDQTAGTPTLAVNARAPAGGTCGTRACWKTVGIHGFKYSDPLATPDGLFKLLLREGAAGHAKILVRALGGNLTLPPPSNSKLLHQDPKVIVQLVNDAATPQCWEADYSQPALQNILGAFRDRAD